MLLMSSADLFSKLTFENNSFRNTIRVTNGLVSDQDDILSVLMSVLIWVQTVCKGYQQITKVVASKDYFIYMYMYIKVMYDHLLVF